MILYRLRVIIGSLYGAKEGYFYEYGRRDKIFALKFQGVIDWEAELKKTDIEKYISWLQDFLDHIEDSTEHEKVRQLFELEG